MFLWVKNKKRMCPTCYKECQKNIPQYRCEECAKIKVNQPQKK